jgi:hypothetical protein
VYPPLPDPSGPGALERGRDAYRRRAWREAHAQLSAADGQLPLEPEDLQRLAITCSMLGRNADTPAYMARAYQGFVFRREPERAARAAFYTVVVLRLVACSPTVTSWTVAPASPRMERLSNTMPVTAAAGRGAEIGA